MKTIDEIFENSISKIEDSIRLDVPNVVYHYTTNIGIIGILKTGKLWMSDLFHMNDPMELEYGIARAKRMATVKVIRGLVTDRDFKNSRIANCLDIIRKNLNEDVFIRDVPVFVASFCGKKDLLSQWKGYSNSCGGYSIGISRECLEREDRYVLGRVIYDIDKQAELLSTVYNILDYVDLSAEDSDAYITSKLCMLIKVLSCYFKDEYFKEEEEYRLVKYDLGEAEMHVRKSCYGVTPYIEYDLGDIRTSIETITVGPRFDYAMNKRALGAFIDSALVEGSRCKLR